MEFFLGEISINGAKTTKPNAIFRGKRWVLRVSVGVVSKENHGAGLMNKNAARRYPGSGGWSEQLLLGFR